MNRYALFLAFLLLSCQSTRMTTSSAEVPRIEVSTDGGIAGRGLGGIVIDHGTATASDLARRCSATLNEAQRAAIARDLTTFRPSQSAPAHPDQIGYAMTAGDVTVKWYGETPPVSAASLFKTVWSIREKTLAGCS